MLVLELGQSADEFPDLLNGASLVTSLVVHVDPFGDAVQRVADDREVLVSQLGEDGVGG
jgi:hypothetical protein